jgi:hypothetical protein
MQLGKCQSSNVEEVTAIYTGASVYALLLENERILLCAIFCASFGASVRNTVW